ncbi:uncharacterized protein LOC105690062 isoform X2 [Athalia rosae]|uniref:uncharacterized protein LOC105690062 isoform X2 n=1 Tax=Athalia rosae TaxID=37344 RepID=UPI0020339AFE|nr:uncharacterized protein LOC105690062 isoform X2 [Athalia rosae]XP_048507857.1 uncharacterized protein LOC105690062 isoform X2 [Athalia rosae]
MYRFDRKTKQEKKYTAPKLLAYARGLASYDVTATTNDHRSRQINEVLQRIEDDEDSAIMKSNVNGRTVEERGGSIYVIEFESESNEFNDGSTNATTESIQVETHGPLDPWSIVWYIGSFGGLVAFFLVVSCSEWCCRRGARPVTISYSQSGEGGSGSSGSQDTPPPPYHLFAPPPYESIYYGDITDKDSGEKMDIFVIAVPVHGSAPVQPNT